MPVKIANMVVGSRVETKLVVVASEIRKTRGNPPRPYCYISMSDGVDTITANLWNYNDATPLAQGVYNVIGIVGDYQGKKQLNNPSFQLCEDQNMDEFSIVFDGNKELLRTRVADAIGTVQNSQLRAFLNELLYDHINEFVYGSSAVGMHHVGIGGNAVHTLEVFEIASEIAIQMQNQGYEVCVDLVRAGALLHDIGKMKTYEIDGPAVNMSLEGILMDHIVIGSNMVQESRAKKMYPEVAELLQHIIASHHGSLEFGSPVTPRFLEAYIVNAADGLSSKAAMLNEAYRKIDAEGKDGLLTGRVYPLSNAQHVRRQHIRKVLDIDTASDL